MRKIDQLFAEYAESHQNHTNKAIHWICVPLIFWSILGFVSLIPAPHFFMRYFGAISLVSLGALLLVTIFYFRLSWHYFNDDSYHAINGTFRVFHQYSIRASIVDGLSCCFCNLLDWSVLRS